MNILAISGSLRPTSTISTLLRATIALAPATMTATMYDGLGDLPHFAPDLTDNPPAPVTRLRDLLRAADGVLICTPEYAYSMPGALKNAFEWTVSWLSRTLDDDEEYTISIRYFPESPCRHEGFHAN